MKESRSIIAMAVSAALLVTTYSVSQNNIDPDHKFTWSENTGWLNWRDAGDPAGSQGVKAGLTTLSGFIWNENVGWINVGDGAPTEGVHYANFDGSDFGVNVDPDSGLMFGLAWGENIGWINFEGGALADPPIPATVDFCNRALSGYVWGENIGWINLDDAKHFVALGPCAFGDYDCNGAVDLDDYSAFQGVQMGPDVPVDCPAFDADDDGDVDLPDFAAFQAAFTGS